MGKGLTGTGGNFYSHLNVLGNINADIYYGGRPILGPQLAILLLLAVVETGLNTVLHGEYRTSINDLEGLID